ncbi:MAG TPA: bifunctional serine/threonine-protein kinase/ABC transporter substrate-binding protein, partial [Gemmataceae bacterium]|nr:bifunctional serine/threonine-protein kinase/ABC transporter substrate-binding protein [Gemmataceae bacterium]
MKPSSCSSQSRRDDAPPNPLATVEYQPPLPDSALTGATQLDAMAGHGQDVEALSSRFGFLSAARGPDELGWLGPYRIRGVLGEGGMGVVFDAEDIQLCRRVALKILKPELALTPLLRERFLQEARAAAALPPEHVVAIYQVGSEADVPYLAMQYLEGESLEQCLHRVGRLPTAEAARLGRDIALGLSVAHEKGLIHRDIKPANIWLETVPGSAAPRVKLLDFGLARVTGNVSSLTASGMIVGTPHYLAPEQARGLTLDHRCDLFALGCVLYRTLTGALPFNGPDLLSLLSSLAIDEPRPIHDRAPETPAKMVELIRELLSKSPSQRPATAREVAERLRALEGVPTPSVPVPLAVAVPVAIPEARTRTAKDGPSRFATGLFLGGVLASLVLILGLWGWIKISNRPSKANVDCSLQGRPIPVGVLQSLSGSWASTSAPIVEAAELAINEINEQGGVLGGRVEPIFVDGSSDESALAAQANRLILENHVCALFGFCSPAGRKHVLPVVEKYNHLLFYPRPCEGLEQSPNIVYVGAAPNQQILPGLQFALGTLRKRRLFLVGTDYVYSRTAHAILSDALAQSPEAQIVGEALFPLGSSDVKEAVEKIAASRADLIVNTISGDTNAAFFRALRAAGVSAEKVPTLSFSLDENELRALPVEQMIGDYAAWNYFQSVNRPENTAFVRKFRARFGPHRVLTDSMESAYVAVHLWA